MVQLSGGIGNVRTNTELVEMAMAYSRSRMLCAAARLGIADLLETSYVALVSWPKTVRLMPMLCIACRGPRQHAI